MMKQTLKEAFIASQGAPVDVEGQLVVQMDRLPIKKGRVRIRFLGGSSRVLCGIAIKSAKGHVVLSDGSRAKLVYIWNQAELPKSVEHDIFCPDGELRVWNIYRLHHSTGQTTIDSWTNNAGMIVADTGPHRRKYRCSDGLGDFNPDDFVFEVEW
jgi:hypothetical protein